MAVHQTLRPATRTTAAPMGQMGARSRKTTPLPWRLCGRCGHTFNPPTMLPDPRGYCDDCSFQAGPVHGSQELIHLDRARGIALCEAARLLRVQGRDPRIADAGAALSALWRLGQDTIGRAWADIASSAWPQGQQRQLFAVEWASAQHAALFSPFGGY